MAGASGVYTLLYSKDVQLSTKRRNSTLRYWGQDEDTIPSAERSIARRLTKRFPNQVYSGPEGIGINHEEWSEEKKKYQSNAITKQEG